MTVLGAASGRSRAAAVVDGWIEPPALWTAVVAPPGSAKTAALAKALAPLWGAETRWRDEHADRVAVYEAEYERYKADKKEWEKGGGKGEPPTPPRKPALRQAVLDRFTGEALGNPLWDRTAGHQPDHSGDFGDGFPQEVDPEADDSGDFGDGFRPGDAYEGEAA